jgi:hypothetical protein
LGHLPNRHDLVPATSPIRRVTPPNYMINKVIKVRLHYRSTNQDKGCWWLKAKSAADDLVGVLSLQAYKGSMNHDLYELIMVKRSRGGHEK